MSLGKKYGLIVSEKAQKLSFQASRNVFGNDSDSDDAPKKKKLVLLRPSDNINRQAKLSQEKAVLEDPTVFQYDEIYDSLNTQKEEKKNKSKDEKKPRYIENLLKTANKRKIENERRTERKVQKERELEGEEFADKEVFVTSAYKKKLEELKMEEEREKREEYLENIGDVTKQTDLGGFYRHLYEQKLGPDKKQNDDHVKTESDKIESNKKSELSSGKKRNYRKRQFSSDKNNLSDGEIEDSDEEINRISLNEIKAKKAKKSEENIDADSDFSIDSSDEESNQNIKKNKQQAVKQTFMEPSASLKVENKINENKVTEEHIQKSVNDNIPLTPPPEPKPKKIDIWKKRTVGEVFEEALKRYYERKSARGA